MAPHSTTRRRAAVFTLAATAGVTTAALAQGEASQLFAYPRQGQSPQQQSTDLNECHYWAVSRTGYDPNFAAGNEPPERRTDYQRAIAACLEARGYTVR